MHQFLYPRRAKMPKTIGLKESFNSASRRRLIKSKWFRIFTGVIVCLYGVTFLEIFLVNYLKDPLIGYFTPYSPPTFFLSQLALLVLTIVLLAMGMSLLFWDKLGESGRKDAYTGNQQ